MRAGSRSRGRSRSRSRGRSGSRGRSRSRSRGRRRLFASPRRDDGTAWGAVAEALHEDAHWLSEEEGDDALFDDVRSDVIALAMPFLCDQQ